MLELIAKIFCAVEIAKTSEVSGNRHYVLLFYLGDSHVALLLGMTFGGDCHNLGAVNIRLRALHAKHQADNLAKLWQEFLSLLELIAKIFCAVEIAKTSEVSGNRHYVLLFYLGDSHVALLLGMTFGGDCHNLGAVNIRLRALHAKHQADNLAKLWQEFLSLLELIAKIFCAVEIAKTSEVSGNRHCVFVSI